MEPCRRKEAVEKENGPDALKLLYKPPFKLQSEETTSNKCDS